MWADAAGECRGYVQRVLLCKFDGFLVVAVGADQTRARRLAECLGVRVGRGASYGDGEAHDAEPQMPDLNEGFVEVLDGFDEVALPEDEVHLALVGDAHELCFHGGCRRGAFKNLAVFFLRP